MWEGEVGGGSMGPWAVTVAAVSTVVVGRSGGWSIDRLVARVRRSAGRTDPVRRSVLVLVGPGRSASRLVVARSVSHNVSTVDWPVSADSISWLVAGLPG